MSDPRGPLAIVGVGDVLHRDDGIGVRVVREIGRRAISGEVTLPPRTELVDGGTLGLGLSPVVASARALVIVDAAMVSGRPGTVAAIPGCEVTSGSAAGRAREDGLATLIDAARLIGTLPAAFTLVGVRPAAIDVGPDLSPAIEAALDAAVAATLREASRLDALVSLTDAAPADVPRAAGAFA